MSFEYVVNMLVGVNTQLKLMNERLNKMQVNLEESTNAVKALERGMVALCISVDALESEVGSESSSSEISSPQSAP